MEILIKEIIHSPIAAFHNEGLQVFGLLEKAKTNHEKVTLSFEGINRCATQFLNACIGKMYLEYGEEYVDKNIKYNFGDLEILHAKIEEVRQNALHALQQQHGSNHGNAIA